MSRRCLGRCQGAVWEVSGRSLGRCPRRCPRRCLGSLSAVWHHESSRLEERRVAADSLRLAAERQQRLADRLLKQRAWVVKLESSNWRAECASSSNLEGTRGHSRAISATPRPWLVRSSGSVARKASSCSGSSRCLSPQPPAAP